jgi:hypothetical protein
MAIGKGLIDFMTSAATTAIKMVKTTNTTMMTAAMPLTFSRLSLLGAAPVVFQSGDPALLSFTLVGGYRFPR